MAKTPTTTTKTTAAPKKAATAEKKPKAPAAPKVAAPKKVAAKKTAHQLPDQDLINKMVAEAAYFIAEKRQFAPGYDQSDWQEAKAQILAQLKNASPPKK